MKKHIAAALIIGLVFCNFTSAATILVPSQYPTIQAGIDAAVNGDTVTIAPGTYTGPGNCDIDFNGKVITVQSASGPETCVIDCNGTAAEPHRGFYFHSGETAGTVVGGFTVTNGYAPLELWSGGMYPLGGAIYCVDSSPTIKNCTLRNNQTAGSWAYGGAIYCRNSNSAITNCSIASNYSSSRGGGIYCNDCNSIIADCAFTNNSAGGLGGAINIVISNAAISNCTIIGNYLTSTNPSSSGGGIYSAGSNIIISDTILWANESVNGPQLSVQAINDSGIVYSNVSVSFSDVQGGQTQVYVSGGCTLNWLSGNIVQDPKVTPDGYLCANSPCINAGDPAFSPSPGETDINGEQRVYGGTVDIGCDEFIDTDGDGLPDWWETKYFGSPTAANPNDDPDGDGFNNLKEYNSGGNPLAPPIKYYVNPAAGNDLWDGLSATYSGGHGPKATIQATIDAVHPCGDVVLAEGIYRGNGNRDIDFRGKAITVRSTDPNDPNTVAQTIIDCNGTITDFHRGFYFHDSETINSVLSGVTITNGYTYGGSAILCYGGSPTIEHCVITKNYAYWINGCGYSPCPSPPHPFPSPTGTGGGIFIHGGNPIITDCTIINNIACAPDNSFPLLYSYDTGAGGGIYSESSNLVITDCTITKNQGGGISTTDVNSVITRCTITKNNYDIWGTASHSGGIYCNGNVSISDCFIAYNMEYSRGAGIRCGSRAASVKIANCAIVGNETAYAGTITGYGGGIFTSSPQTIITNCVIYANSAANGSQIAAWVSGNSPHLNVSYCDVLGSQSAAYIPSGCTLNWGQGNIDVDPKLTPDGHLLTGSPCINAGDPNYPMDANDTDFDGEPRVFGGRVDIGADEFIDTDGDGLPDFWEKKYFGSPTAADPNADPDGDGYNNLAEYQMSGNPLVPAVTYYVNPVSGNDSWDGLSAQHVDSHGPKKTISGAFAVAADYGGDRIILAPGTYIDGEYTQNCNIDFNGKVVTIQSTDPCNPAVVAATIINCQNNGRGFIFRCGEGPYSMLNGLTIINGRGGTENVETYVQDDGFYWTHGGSNIGGAVFCYNSSPTIKNCTFKNNSCDYGGVIYLGHSNSLVTDCNFTGNTAVFDDAIYVVRGGPVIKKCAFAANYPYGVMSAAIYNSPNVSLTITDCNFAGHTDTAIWSTGGDTKITGCNITSGYSGISCAGNTSITNCTITGISGGDGIYIDSGQPTIMGCTITNNNNSDGYEGSTIYCNRYSQPLITNCTISGNNSHLGAIYAQDSNPTIRNCVISGNRGGLAGGIFCDYTSEITGCTIVGNKGFDPSRAGGIWVAGGTVTNCIIRDNDANQTLPSGAAITFCNVQGGWEGSGNIDADPCFVTAGYWDASDFWVDGDYHLRANSPCIDTGNPAYVPEPNETDLGGLPRVSGARVDMGAYEYIPNSPPVACITVASQTVEAQGPFGANITLDGSCSSDPNSTPGTNDDIKHFDWYKLGPGPNDKTLLGSGEMLNRTLPIGQNNIMLKVTDKAGATDSKQITILVRDTTAPIITCPSDITLEGTGPSGAIATFTVSATDIADPSPIVVCSPHSGTMFPYGTTTVSCTATDSSGNSASCQFHVTVQDTTPPFASDGDFNRDNIVDMKDFAILANAWMSQSGQPKWNPLCDISNPADNSIDWNDLAVFASNWLAGAE